jgi:hypothetical protein
MYQMRGPINVAAYSLKISKMLAANLVLCRPFCIFLAFELLTQTTRRTTRNTDDKTRYGQGS